MNLLTSQIWMKKNWKNIPKLLKRPNPSEDHLLKKIIVLSFPKKLLMKPRPEISKSGRFIVALVINRPSWCLLLLLGEPRKVVMLVPLLVQPNWKFNDRFWRELHKYVFFSCLFTFFAAKRNSKFCSFFSGRTFEHLG